MNKANKDVIDEIRAVLEGLFEYLNVMWDGNKIVPIEDSIKTCKMCGDTVEIGNICPKCYKEYHEDPAREEDPGEEDDEEDWDGADEEPKHPDDKAGWYDEEVKL